jgi:steroid delta-isomerase-like uncharacterized protein
MRQITLALALSLFLPVLTKPQPAQQPVTTQFLQTFADAFNAHDLNAIMAHMTSDCVFEASAGTQVDGEKYVGQQEVRKAFEAVFAAFHDAHWGNARHIISGDRGFSEWVFTGTTADGKKVQVTGVDLFTFREGKIAIKNSYRKNRSVTP